MLDTLKRVAIFTAALLQILIRMTSAAVQAHSDRATLTSELWLWQPGAHALCLVQAIWFHGNVSAQGMVQCFYASDGSQLTFA